MRFIVVLILLALAALLALLLFAPRYDYDIVVDLPTQVDAASGGAFVGVGDPKEEVGIECPVGIEFSTGQELVLVDPATRRILSIDVAARRVVSAGAINLDPTVFPVAAVFEDGRLWLWGQDSSGDIQLPISLSRDGDVWYGQTQDLPPRGSRALDRFRDLGLSPQQPASAAAPDPSNNPASTAVDSYQPPPAFDWSEIVPGANGRGSTARLRVEGAVVKLEVQGADGVGRAAEVRATRQVLTAHVLGAGPGGEIYFTVQNWDPKGADFDIREEVRRTDLLDAIYDVPLAEGDCVAKQHVAVSPSGDIYALRVQEQRVSILKLKPRSFLTKVRAWLEAQGIDLPRLSVGDVLGAKAQTLQSNNNKIARRDVVANACAYLREPWDATDAHLAAPAGTCPCGSNTCNRQYTPATDKVVAGKRIAGLPYNWGGHDLLADFQRKVKVGAGRSGGNVCTNGDKGILRDSTDTTGIHPAGVDCSGFVTRALGYRGPKAHFATSILATIADPVAKLDMRPGDIANKAGSHVRMLLNWQRPASGAPWNSVEMIESTTASDGVRRWPYFLDELSGRGAKGGYVMLRPKRIVNTGAPLDIDLITCRVGP